MGVKWGWNGGEGCRKEIDGEEVQTVFFFVCVCVCMCVYVCMCMFVYAFFSA